MDDKIVELIPTEATINFVTNKILNETHFKQNFLRYHKIHSQLRLSWALKLSAPRSAKMDKY